MTAVSPLPVRPPRLSRSRRTALYVIAAGTWATGTSWLVFHYALMRETPFGPSPNPLEFWSRAAHGAFAFAALWLFGMLCGAHIVEGWRNSRSRGTGTIMFALFAWLVFSGYLLYYAGNERLLAAVTLLHWIVGISCPVPFLLHRFASEKAKTAMRPAGTG